MAAAITGLLAGLTGGTVGSKEYNLFRFWVEQEVSRRQRSVDVKMKKIQADVDIKRINQSEMTKRAQSFNQTEQTFINESDQILNAIDNAFWVQKTTTKGGRNRTIKRISPLSWIILCGTVGKHFGESAQARNMGKDCYMLIKNIIDKSESLARTSSASNLSFNLPPAEDVDQSMIPDVPEEVYEETEGTYLEPPPEEGKSEVNVDVDVEQPPAEPKEDPEVKKRREALAARIEEELSKEKKKSHWEGGPDPDIIDGLTGILNMLKDGLISTDEAKRRIRELYAANNRTPPGWA